VDLLVVDGHKGRWDDALPTWEPGDKVDPKDVFRRVPNRQDRRDTIRLRGEPNAGRSRIRRRVNRMRRYYEGK